MSLKHKKFTKYFPYWHPLKDKLDLINNAEIQSITKITSQILSSKSPTEEKLTAAMEFIGEIQSYAVAYEDIRNDENIAGKRFSLQSHPVHTDAHENIIPQIVGATATASNTRGLWEFLEYFGTIIPSAEGIADWKEHEFIAVYLLHLINKLLQAEYGLLAKDNAPDVEPQFSGDYESIEKLQSISMEIADSFVLMRLYMNSINNPKFREYLHNLPVEIKAALRKQNSESKSKYAKQGHEQSDKGRLKEKVLEKYKQNKYPNPNNAAVKIIAILKPDYPGNTWPLSATAELATVSNWIRTSLKK
jgi:hypothetical protein